MSFNFKEEQYEIGQPIIDKLGTMNDEQIKSTVKSLVGTEIAEEYDHLFNNVGTNVKRFIINEWLESIIIEYWDELEINYLGIYLTPEHGTKKKLLEFTKHITI
jgi:hypothetical protein